MKTLGMLLSLVVVFLVMSISALGGASTQTLSMKIPLVLSEFIPCANQGNGEVVDLRIPGHGDQ